MKKHEIGLYEKALPKDLSWIEKFRIAKSVGYDYIEISIDETPDRLSRLDIDKSTQMNLLTAMSETGMHIGSMCLSAHRKYPFGSTDPKIRQQSMDIMAKALVLASSLGARTIQLAGYDVYYEDSTNDTKKYFFENLHRAVELANKYGVALGFETMETPFMNTVEKAMNYVQLINSPYLGVYPDSGNITNAALSDGKDVLADIRAGAGHIIAFHLKESLPGKFREIPFGTGHVDFPAIIHQAWQLGVRRFVTEFWDIGSPNWREDIAFAFTMMNTLILEEQ